MIIRLTRNAVYVLNRVYTDKSIYDSHGHFTDWFLKWNGNHVQFAPKGNNVYLYKLSNLSWLLIFFIGNQRITSPDQL